MERSEIILIILLGIFFAILFIFPITEVRAEIADPMLYVCETLIYEASSEGIQGMTEVANVIRNRSRERKLSLNDIIFEKWQFSCNNPCQFIKGRDYLRLCKKRGKCEHKHKYTESEMNNAVTAWGSKDILFKKANLYCRVDCYPSWIYAGSVKYLGTYKNHKFYYEKR